MDILDEIDAAIQEKKSKWKYAPMREKNETDAIIDELLKEFPSGGYEEDQHTYQPPQADVTPVPESKQPAEKAEVSKQEKSVQESAVPEQEHKEAEPYVYNEEQMERRQYEASLKNAYDAEEQTESENYVDKAENDYVQPSVNNGSEAHYDESESSGEFNEDENETHNESELNDEPAAVEVIPENTSGGNDEYNEYISRKYTSAKYAEEEDTTLYNDDEYDGEDDDEDDFEEFEEEMPEESGKKKYTDKDFNNFMDSANDGEKGDIPKFSVSSAVLTILKIVVLAAFGALAVVGIINTVSIGVDKYNKVKSKPDSTLKEELQSVIYPVVVTETADFKSASELTSEQLVNIAVWEVVINGNKSVFLNSDTGEFYLPQEQMAYIIEKLFGEDTGFKHTDSGIGDKKIVYDAKNKQYVLPENTDLYTLRPVVTDVAQTGDIFAVYADCYRSNPPWSSVKSDEPVKRVVVTMKKTSDYYNISELKTIPLN